MKPTQASGEHAKPVFRVKVDPEPILGIIRQEPMDGLPMHHRTPHQHAHTDEWNPEETYFSTGKSCETPNSQTGPESLKLLL